MVEAEDKIMEGTSPEERHRTKLTERELELAKEDIKNTRKAVSRLPLHRASPPWSAPNAAWKCIWMPSWRHERGNKGGIGAQKKDLDKLKAPTFWYRIADLFEMQRRTGYFPMNVPVVLDVT